MKQLVAIVAVCRLAILERMSATPLTLLVVDWVREGSRKSGVNFPISTGKCAKTEVTNAKAEPPEEREKKKTAL